MSGLGDVESAQIRDLALSHCECGEWTPGVIRDAAGFLVYATRGDILLSPSSPGRRRDVVGRYDLDA
jgi:hypothetical protein